MFTAEPPKGVGTKKYDESASGMISLLKYGSGLPFNRIERLERVFGIPLPASTQWEVVEEAAVKVMPAWEELIRQAAQGEVLYNDDTTIKILALMAKNSASNKESDEKEESCKRTGMFTSGIVSTTGDRRIALFFSGRQHAGENLADVLKERAEELGPPIQMCDALSSNTANVCKTILAYCNAHARRKYVDEANNFPEEVKHVLEEIGKVYKNDATTKEQNMSPEERLEYHRINSKPVMDELKKWLKKQKNEIEPNPGLGGAIKYMTKNWDQLTRFLHVPGCPIDNSICERAIKKVILHRKNSLFFKTLNGARVGDMFMSLIHTCELNGIDAFDYLVSLQRFHEEVKNTPQNWMPWNYRAAVDELESAAVADAPESSPGQIP